MAKTLLSGALFGIAVALALQTTGDVLGTSRTSEFPRQSAQRYAEIRWTRVATFFR